MLERVGDLQGVRECVLQGRDPVLQHLAQRPAFDELHHDERGARGLPDLVDGTDVGMSQRRSVPCLAKQAAACGFIAPHSAHNLDGHLASENGVPSAIHLTHPAGRDEAGDLVGTEPRAIGKARSRVLTRPIVGGEEGGGRRLTEAGRRLVTREQ